MLHYALCNVISWITAKPLLNILWNTGWYIRGRILLSPVICNQIFLTSMKFEMKSDVQKILKFKNDSKCWLMLNIIKSNVCCFYLFFARKNEIKVGIGNVTIHVFIHTVIWEVLVQMNAWGWLVKQGLMFKDFVCNQHRTAWKGAVCIFWMWVFVTKGPICELRKLKTTCMSIIVF